MIKALKQYLATLESSCQSVGRESDVGGQEEEEDQDRNNRDVRASLLFQKVPWTIIYRGASHIRQGVNVSTVVTTLPTSL